MKKKIKYKETYKKRTIADNPNEIIELIKKSYEIEVKSQILYDDDSKSVTLTIYYDRGLIK